MERVGIVRSFNADAISIQGWVDDESGQDLIEYSLLFLVVGMGCVAYMKNLSQIISTFFARLETYLP